MKDCIGSCNILQPIHCRHICARFYFRVLRAFGGNPFADQRSQPREQSTQSQAGLGARSNAPDIHSLSSGRSLQRDWCIRLNETQIPSYFLRLTCPLRVFNSASVHL